MEFQPFGVNDGIRNYVVELEDVSVLELTIKPDLSQGNGLATLVSYRIG